VLHRPVESTVVLRPSRATEVGQKQTVPPRDNLRIEILDPPRYGVMEPQEFPTGHFEQMTKLARALTELPVQILGHEYSYESFGSWSLTLRHKGHVAQLVYDGRDDSLTLRQSDDRKPPYSFGPDVGVAGRTGLRALDQRVIGEICRAITLLP